MARLSWGILLGSTLVFGLGCETPMSSQPTTGTSIPTYMAPEKGYCSTVTTYTGSTVTIDGVAQYKARQPFGDKMAGGLGGAGAAQPIRYAEVRVTNTSGTLVQCDETDATGTYSFVLPQSSGTLTVTVTSRSNNSNVKAYIYDDPRYNNYYALTTTFTPDLTKTLATMTAEVTGAVLGGAFNILDQILKANEYLRAQVSNCSATFTGCSNFTVAPKSTVYWKLGFNPAEYYGSTSSGISFYLPGYSRLFILGGIEDDYDNEYGSLR
jgi:hypothetical protein